ncbi:YtxH domain-containing protein [Fictibacillus nanhaiensis]|uniref:YtxH domain-containing protein n=1 Tax=Fictibacillus nanhaiensis TaxID=742169 RepID=UPI001C97FA69|nr:YtxH domain-containing protein [Fictibacillus nanhaiensis]MBY6036488.1 YtxH domain-containing protein [Fictibacillus nanhaiensis]
MQNETTTTAEPVFTQADFQTRDTYDDKKGSGSGFKTGLVLGGLVGAAAAFLYAPKKGNELREDLRDSSIRLKERTMQLKDETMLKAQLGKMDAKDGMDSLKEKTSNMTISARQKLQEAKNTANEGKKEAEKDGYVTQSSATSSVSAQQKTGTDSSYAKKQSDVNTKTY